MITSHPDALLQSDTLRAQVLELCTGYSKSRRSALPAWIDMDAAHFLGTAKLVVCGSTCREELRLLARNANVVAVVDDFCKDRLIFGIPVINSAEWIRRARADVRLVSVFLLPGSTGYNFFVKLAAEYGLRHLLPFQFQLLLDEAGISKKGYVGRFFVYGVEFFDGVLAGIDRREQVARIFDDEFSRVTFYSLLMYRLTSDPNYLTRVGVGHGVEPYCPNSYVFNEDFFRFGDDEIYVDGGSFVGETIEKFIRATGNRFSRIFSFEPSAQNVASIRQRIAALSAELLDGVDMHRIEIQQKGLWSSDTELQFYRALMVSDAEQGQGSNPQSAHFIEGGILNHVHDYERESAVLETLSVTTVDAVTGGEASLIKLEIEGAELAALNGAVGTIRTSRPKMALSVYHKAEDLHTIPDFVTGLDLGYRYALRQHNPLVPDATVLYCCSG